MKNFKQITFGLLVGALALGFSAFTTAHNNTMKITRNAKGKIISVTASYFRLPPDASTSTDMNASHYVYSDGTRAGCTSGPSNICDSHWRPHPTQVDDPSPNDAGSPSFVSDNPQKGIYNGN